LLKISSGGSPDQSQFLFQKNSLTAVQTQILTIQILKCVLSAFIFDQFLAVFEKKWLLVFFSLIQGAS